MSETRRGVTVKGSSVRRPSLISHKHDNRCLGISKDIHALTLLACVWVKHARRPKAMLHYTNF